MDLPAPRDQIPATRRPQFVRLRTVVSRLNRARPGQQEVQAADGAAQAAAATWQQSSPLR